jgi:hypothetical protein
LQRVAQGFQQVAVYPRFPRGEMSNILTTAKRFFSGLRGGLC